MINKVEVIQAFPGYVVGDQLTVNTVGNYEYTGNAKDASNDAFNVVEEALYMYKPLLTRRAVVEHIGSYFKDITVYMSASEKEIVKRINDLKGFISTYTDDSIALTVWQNLIWELEWVLGKRQIGDTK